MPVLKTEFRKKSFIMNDFLQNPHFSAQNVLLPRLSLHMHFFIPKVFLKRPENAEFKKNEKILKEGLPTSHSMVVSLWNVTEPLYIEISRSDGPQKGATTVDLTHLKSYEIIQTMSKGILSHSKSFWVI